MKNVQKGFIVPLLLGIIAVLIIGGGIYYYHTKNIKSAVSQTSQVDTQATTETPTQTATQTSTSSGSQAPTIVSLSASTVPLGGTFTISATNLNPIPPAGGVGNGWIESSHVFVFIVSSSGQQGILWEGGGEGEQNVVGNTIIVTVPVTGSACVNSVEGAGMCIKPISLTPGQYSIYLSVDGRGTSNKRAFTIVASTATSPTVSSLTSSSNPPGQFYSGMGDEVTITGSNFPVDGKNLPIVWLNGVNVPSDGLLTSAKVTDVTGLVSATSQTIIFTPPLLAPGTYNLYVTGLVGQQTADPVSPGVTVQSNMIQVTVLPNTTVSYLSPTTVNVGGTIQIYGKGFVTSPPSAGYLHEDVHAVYISVDNKSQSSVGGIVWSGDPVNDTTINFTLPSRACTFGGAPGVACTQWVNLTPGDYTLIVNAPDGFPTTPLNFTITQ